MPSGGRLGKAWLYAVLLACTCCLHALGMSTTALADDGTEIIATSAGAGTRTTPDFNRETTTPNHYSGNGTDPDLREIFLGRCADFKAGKVNPSVDLDELRHKNCSALWELFSSTFMYREACDVTETMYEPFVEAAYITIPLDKATYWDGWDVYPIVHSYAMDGQRSWSLEWTLVGYLVNNLRFCGQTEAPGLRYDSCPGENECGFAKGSADAFWAMASTYFGKQAKGNVRVFFNTNREGGAFQNEDSYFAQFELVNMPPEAVERVDIYLITSLQDQPGDECDSASIQELTDILTSRNLSYKCHDQPRDVLHLLCIDGYGLPECLFKNDVLSPTEFAITHTTDSSSYLRARGTLVIFATLAALFVNFIHIPHFT